MRFLEQVQNELERASAKYPDLCSLHEAYAVILEKVDELKAEVWKQQRKRDWTTIYSELVQMAAMCARTVQDLRLEPEQQEQWIQQPHCHTIGFTSSEAMEMFLRTSSTAYALRTVDLDFDYKYAQATFVSSVRLSPEQCSAIACAGGVCYLHLNAIRE